MILTTHDMADIESLCSRVMLIGGGKKLLDGDISLLRKGREKRKLVCTLDRPPLQVELAEPGLEISLKQNRLEVQFSPENTPAAWLIGEISEKYGVSYLPSDFKKREGYKRSIELSKKYGLYRQNFCGCLYSKIQADKNEPNFSD